MLTFLSLNKIFLLAFLFIVSMKYANCNCEIIYNKILHIIELKNVKKHI